MRPELTMSAIYRVLSWSNLNKLTIMIDGIRKNADENEINWRNQTIKSVENIANSNNQVDLWVYSENIANTDHVFRTLLRGLEIEESAIWLEEDIEINLEEYLELQSSNWTTTEPFLLTAYSHGSHGKTLRTKKTLFPPFWGLSVNFKLYEEALKVWKDKQFDDQVVKNAINQVFYKQKVSSFYISKLTDYWTNYSRWGIESNRRWDSLANYAIIKSGNFATSSTERLANDISYLDYRGMNQRIQPKNVIEHEAKWSNINDNLFCIICEISGSRIEPKLINRLDNSIRYRSGNILKKIRVNHKAHQEQWYQE